MADDGSMLSGQVGNRRKWPNWDDPVRYLGFSSPANFYKTHQELMFLYFMTSGPFLKIGITSNLETRLTELRAGNPHGIRVASKREMPRALARQVEKRLHVHFAPRSIGREWFKELTAKEAVAVAHPWVKDARTAVQRWIDDGYLRFDS